MAESGHKQAGSNRTPIGLFTLTPKQIKTGHAGYRSAERRRVKQDDDAGELTADELRSMAKLGR